MECKKLNLALFESLFSDDEMGVDEVKKAEYEAKQVKKAKQAEARAKSKAKQAEVAKNRAIKDKSIQQEIDNDTHVSMGADFERGKNENVSSGDKQDFEERKRKERDKKLGIKR